MFESIKTEEQAYWLGFIIADGCITVHKSGIKYLKISLKGSDIEHLRKFKGFLGSSNKISTYKVNSSQTKEKIYECCEFKIGSKELCEQLSQYGVVPRKSFTCYLPEIDSNLTRHLIRGIWDGDGSVFYSAVRKKYPDNIIPTVQLCGNASILNSVQEVFKEELGIQSSKLSKVSSIYLFRKSCTPAKKICTYLYDNSSISLDRKCEKAIDSMAWYSRKAV